MLKNIQYYFVAVKWGFGCTFVLALISAGPVRYFLYTKKEKKIKFGIIIINLKNFSVKDLK